jgi:hypothetical protein
MARIHRPKPIAMAESSAHIVASIHPSPISGDPAVARWVCRRCLRGWCRQINECFRRSSCTSGDVSWLIYTTTFSRWCYWTIVLIGLCFEEWDNQRDWLSVLYYETTRGPRSDLWLGVVYYELHYLLVASRANITTMLSSAVPNSFIDEGMKDWYKWMVSTQKGPGLLGWLLQFEGETFSILLSILAHVDASLTLSAIVLSSSIHQSISWSNNKWFANVINLLKHVEPLLHFTSIGGTWFAICKSTPEQEQTIQEHNNQPSSCLRSWWRWCW